MSLSQQLLQHLKTHEFVRPGDRVAVAVSGGADSVALLLLLLELRAKLGIVLSIVHFNHKLRGKASDADEKFVAKLAAKYGLELHSTSLDVAKKAKKERANLEDAARRARYDYFRSLADSGVCTCIAVAHTADDQAETVLAHILRGTGLAGLGGIHPVAGPVVRPLLTIRRSELRAYLRRKKQNWREDLTNRDTKRMRARIRKKLLPPLERQFQPVIVEHLATLAHLAREEEALLEAIAGNWFDALAQKENRTVKLGADVAVSPLFWPAGEIAQIALGRRLVRAAFAAVAEEPGQLTFRHVEAVLRLAESGENGRLLQLPGGVVIRREENDLVFLAESLSKRKSGAEKESSREYEYTIDLSRGSQDLRVPELGCVFHLRLIDWPSDRGETKSEETVLDRDRLRSPLVLRNWRPGDRLRPFGHQNAHKLKRLLNEKRISRWERDGWPVLTTGGVLVWARGFPVAADFAGNERTRTGIVIAEEPL